MILMPRSPYKTAVRYGMLSIIALALIFLGVGIGAALAKGVNISWKGSYEIGYADFIGIVLSALSVLLTVLAIFLAIFGVIGWASFSERLRESSYSFLGDQLSEGKSLYNLIRKEVREAVYEGVEPVTAIPENVEEKPFGADDDA